MAPTIEELRSLRTTEDLNLKPSPFLKKSYFDDSKKEKPVILRNYQKIGVMNTLISPRILIGDQTGTGKTIQVLTAIGYIWLKEPNYIPIIITTKSSLFQWKSEIEKFMVGMEAVVVDGVPHKRHAIYENFFLNHKMGEKRLLLMTYDNIMYDIDGSVIKEKARSPRKGFAKEFKAVKERCERVKNLRDSSLEFLKEHFLERDKLESAPFAYSSYAKSILSGQKNVVEPKGWSEKDEKVVSDVLSSHKELKELENTINSMREEKAPSKKVPGVLDYTKELKIREKNIRFMIIMDEMHKLKNHKSQFHEKTKALSRECDRIIGMTATPVKNRLMEFFSLFSVIEPSLFPRIGKFQDEFCVMKMQPIGRGRQVPVVVGYRNLDIFVQKIEPFYLSRKKRDVAKELPQLISVEVDCELSELQEELYNLAELGVVESKETNLLDENSEGSEILRCMTMCQQVVDSPSLIMDEDGNPFEGSSSKIEALLDLLQQTEDQKMIVYSRYEKMISIIEDVLNKEKINCVRITGKENDPKYREKVKNIFQNPDSGTNVILITNAGSESINLQAAQNFVFMDLPWSYGDYLQLIGRMERIGSTHTTIVAYHLLGRKLSGKKTIDHHVLQGLRSKKNLADRVSGESLKGGLEFVKEDSIKEIIESMKMGESESNPKISQKFKKIRSTSDKISKPKKNEEINLFDLDI